ncbi:MAG: type III pantothenate kinase [Nitrospiraceae bacterium]|nr:type III pantothenate kinase [Nitrospiraceae bacterium]
MLIALDIGNSSINIGLFDGGRSIWEKIPTHPLGTDKEYASKMSSLLREKRIEKEDISCIISSVVLTHTPVLVSAVRMLAGRGEILQASHLMRLGITLKVRAPEEMGTDRIAGAAGAFALYKSPVAVVDFGTATTVTVVAHDGNCRGGAILPGLGLMNRSLEAGTSRLKAVDLKPAATALGDDTVNNIRSGLYFGTAGAVERILSEIEQETGCDFTTVITGGGADEMEPFMRRSIIKRPHVVLEGLKVLYEYNKHS